MTEVREVGRSGIDGAADEVVADEDGTAAVAVPFALGKVEETPPEPARSQGFGGDTCAITSVRSVGVRTSQIVNAWLCHGSRRIMPPVVETKVSAWQEVTHRMDDRMRKRI